MKYILKKVGIEGIIGKKYNKSYAMSSLELNNKFDIENKTVDEMFNHIRNI